MFYALPNQHDTDQQFADHTVYTLSELLDSINADELTVISETEENIQIAQEGQGAWEAYGYNRMVINPGVLNIPQKYVYTRDGVEYVSVGIFHIYADRANNYKLIEDYV